MLIGIIIYDMGFFNVIEGLNRDDHKPKVGTCPKISDAQITVCNKTKNTVYKNNSDISNLQNKLKSLQKWQSDIVKTIKLNTNRNKANKDNIKRTTQVVQKGAKDKEKEMDKAGEGM